MRNLIAALVITCITSSLFAQKFMTKTGHISFFSKAPLENIEANNTQVSSILDASTGDIVFSMLMKSFNFQKALMQEHFNEKFIESDKYPKAEFKGKIANLSSIDFKKEGPQNAEVVELTAERSLLVEQRGPPSLGRGVAHDRPRRAADERRARGCAV